MKNLNEELKEELKETGVMGRLKTQNWAIGVFAFLITPLMFHTGTLIIEISGFDFKLEWIEYIYSGFFALGFDLAIITFAVNGRKRSAGAMAFFVILFNFAFFNLDFFNALGSVYMDADGELATGIPDDVEARKLLVEGYPWSKLLISLLISALGGWIVHSYVSFFVEKGDQRSKLFIWMGKTKAAEEKISALSKDLESKVRHLRSYHKRAKKLILTARKQKQDIVTYKKTIEALDLKLTELKVQNSQLVEANALLEAKHLVSHSLVSQNGGAVNGESKQVEETPYSQCLRCERPFKSRQQQNSVQGKCDRCKAAKAEEAEKAKEGADLFGVVKH